MHLRSREGATVIVRLDLVFRTSPQRNGYSLTSIVVDVTLHPDRVMFFICKDGDINLYLISVVICAVFISYISSTIH
jgi:hypothetical protein